MTRRPLATAEAMAARHAHAYRRHSLGTFAGIEVVADPTVPEGRMELGQPTSSWTQLLPRLIDSLESGSPAMKVLAKDELERMAELADQYVGLCK